MYIKLTDAPVRDRFLDTQPRCDLLTLFHLHRRYRPAPTSSSSDKCRAFRFSNFPSYGFVGVIAGFGSILSPERDERIVGNVSIGLYV